MTAGAHLLTTLDDDTDILQDLHLGRNSQLPLPAEDKDDHRDDKVWLTTLMMMWSGSCDDPDNHWWRCCDNPIDNLTVTLRNQKAIGDYIVKILLMNSWWPLKILWWQIYDDIWRHVKTLIGDFYHWNQMLPF